MTTDTTKYLDSLEDELDMLAMEIMEIVPADMMEIMMDKAMKLAKSGILENAVKKGDKVNLDFELPDSRGNLVSAKKLLAKGPLVVSFFRGEWCPYCNAQLTALQKVAAEFKRSGASVIALSPQTIDKSAASAAKSKVEDFPLISDPSNQVAKTFRINWDFDEELKGIYRKLGLSVEDYNADGKWSLPLAATYVLAPDGTVVYAFLSTKYWTRAEPASILNAIPVTKRQSSSPKIFYSIRRKAKTFFTYKETRRGTVVAA